MSTVAAPKPVPEFVSERIQVEFTINEETTVHGTYHSREIAEWEAFRLSQKIPGAEISLKSVPKSDERGIFNNVHL